MGPSEVIWEKLDEFGFDFKRIIWELFLDQHGDDLRGKKYRSVRFYKVCCNFRQKDQRFGMYDVFGMWFYSSIFFA